MDADDIKMDVFPFGDFRDLFGHEGGINPDQCQGVIDLDGVQGRMRDGISGRCFGDGDIHSSIPGIPMDSEEDVIKKASCRMQGQEFLFLFGLGMIPGKGGGKEQEPQDAYKKGVLSYFHKKINGLMARCFFLKEAFLIFIIPFLCGSRQSFCRRSFFILTHWKREKDKAQSMDFNDRFSLVWLKSSNPDERDKCLVSQISLKKQEILL
jgi:hypothetical protein